MIKQDWTKKRSGCHQTTIESLVGRAEDCRKADMLKSLVRFHVGGWHEISEKVSYRNMIYFSKFQLKVKLVNQNRLTYFKT